jgi:hypothetical protein
MTDAEAVRGALQWSAFTMSWMFVAWAMSWAIARGRI